MKIKQQSVLLLILFGTGLAGCRQGTDKADAYGNFEVEETVIAAQASGELLQFNVEEGDRLQAGQMLGYIDSTTLVIQKQELRANIAAVQVQRVNIAAEQKVLDAELANLQREYQRLRKLLKAEAATQKQVDDLQGNIKVVQRKKEALNSKYIVLDAQVEAMQQKMALLDEQLQRCRIINPLEGLVLTKLARAHELVAPGKPLYKIANLQDIYLKAYVSETQLASLRLGQQVKVAIDDGQELRTLPGKITWIAAEAEFTPKIIQTKEERVNLVYGIKVAVENDGSLKIGMPGEVYFE